MQYLTNNKKEVIIISREENLYKNLENQINKIARHNRQGSYKTRERYYQSNLRFAKYIAKEFGVQNYSNIKDKHLESYVSYMKDKGLSPSTIKTDLSAIRFFNDQNSNAKNYLSDNSKFDLEQRTFGGVDRSWTDKEYSDFKQLCVDRGMDRIANISTLAKNEGLRIHETLRLDRSQAESAIRTGTLIIKGKGGKVREVSVSKESKQMLQNAVLEVDRGNKLFIKEDEPTHLVIKQVQNFINRNREHYQSPDREQNITFHGLRHTYAQETYNKCIENGLNECQARLQVSQLLGHERDDVTRIYLNK